MAVLSLVPDPIYAVDDLDDDPVVPRWQRWCGYGVVMGGWLALGLTVVDWKMRRW